MEALTPLHLHAELPISNLDLFTGDTLKSLKAYYELCAKASDLLVTTSCFAAWKIGKSTNGCAKVIPAVPAADRSVGQAVRVFFFDDNINLALGKFSGSAETKGICNLRDITTGAYVDFSAGRNGFVCESAFRHTLIHHSAEYRNVLVQANILDAMSNLDYFTSIISKYKQAGEKLIVFMDVNGTILWNDSIMNMGPDEILLGTMFGFTEVRPRKPLDVKWGNEPPLRLEETQILKQLMHDIAKGDSAVLHGFWKRDQCERLMAELVSSADLGWVGHPGCFSSQEFFSVYKDYMAELRRQDQEQGDSGGITGSWFRCLAALRESRHAVVINSFGMDTHRVVIKSARDARRVIHIAVNVELWSERDTSKFKAQFESEELPPPPPPPTTAPRFLGCGEVTCQGRGGRSCTGTGGVCNDSGADALERFMGPQEPDHIFEFVVRKPSPDVTLGAKVIHTEHGLEVERLFPEGAIQQANDLARARSPRGEALRPGDIIQRVNAVEGDTKAMVEECKRSRHIALVVARPPKFVSKFGLCALPQVDPFEEELVLARTSSRKSSFAPTASMSSVRSDSKTTAQRAVGQV